MEKQRKILEEGFKLPDSEKQFKSIIKALKISFDNSVEQGMSSEFLINLRDSIIKQSIY